jgi:hypothetical protein
MIRTVRARPGKNVMVLNPGRWENHSMASMR